MTVSREKRCQRKNNKLYRVINRVCRINVIKMVRNFLGDGMHLPISVVSNQGSDIETQDLKIVPKDIEAQDMNIVSNDIEKNLNNNIEPLSEHNVNEELIVTPYGTFSKYKQEALLDHYKTKDEDQNKNLNLEVEDISTLEAPTLLNTELGDTDEAISKVISQRENEIEIVDTKIILNRFKIKLVFWLMITNKALGTFSKIFSRKARKAYSFVSKELGVVGNFVYKNTIGRVPNSFKEKMNSKLSRSLDNFSILTVKLIDSLDEKFGLTEQKFDEFEEKMGFIYKKIQTKAEIVMAYFKKAKAKVIYLYQYSIKYAEKNPKRVFVSATSALGLFIVLSLLVGSLTAYEYSYNGKVLGLVKKQNDVYVTVDVIGDKLTKAYGADIVIDKDKNISFKKVIAFNQKIDSREDVLNSFTYLKDMEVAAYAIAVDGKQIAILDNKASVDAILSGIQNKYLRKSDSVKYDSVGFAENVQIKQVNTKLGSLQEKNKVMDFMLTGAMEKKIHTVKSGETFSGIAGSYGIKQAQLIASNPGIAPDKLQIGQQIVMTAAAPVLTVQTTETAKYNQSLPFKITYENTAAKYKGESSVKSRGSVGEKAVVAKVVRNNGVEVSRTEISSVVISEPINQVVLVGTKNPPPLIGTGSFMSPVRGIITSRFGYRWGRMHTGVDIAVPTGTSVKAADGGTVIYAARDGSLGLCIRIDHGGNKVTTYGHLSKILVHNGEKVFKGKQIAKSGNTGRSTGPHVHFEVKVNGKFKNPLNYI